MKKLIFLITVMLISFLLVGVSTAQSNEVIIWDPNGNLGTFTDPTANFATVLTHLTASADVTVSGGGTALISAVATAPSGTAADPFVIEVAGGTYDGGIVLTDKTNIVIRAATGASPIIDCSILTPGTSGLMLHATGDRTVTNIAIKGLMFKDIRRRGFGSDPVTPPLNNNRRPASGAGIASFSGKILENIVIEDCVFDNFDATKDETFKGEAIHINEVDGLLIRRNTIKNGGAHGFASADENGAITVHEYDPLPAGGGGTQNDFLNNVFIQNNEILFDYTLISGTAASAQTRGIVLGHVGRTLEKFNNVVIEYNLIDNVQKEGIKVFGTSTDATDDETVHVTNNVIERTADGIEIDGGVVLIDRTIFDGLTSFGPEGNDNAIDHDGGSATVTNTIVVNKLNGTTGSPTVTCIDLFNQTLPHPTLSVVAPFFNVDPIFVSPATNDYTIGNPTFPAGCAGGDFGLELIPPGPANQDPDCSDAAIADQDAGAGCSVTISGADVTSVTDPDNDPLTITVSPTTLPLGLNTVTVTADDGKGGACSTEIVVNVVRTLSPYALLANHEVEVYGMKDSEGDVHANQDVKFYKGGKKTLDGNVTAVENVKIEKKNTINGDVTAGLEVDNDGKVTGTITENGTVDAVPLPEVCPFTPGTEDVEVSKKHSLSLDPGDYSQVEVGEKATLILTSGTYNLEELNMDKKSKLVINIINGEPLVINLTEEIEFEDKVEMSINNGTSADVVINSLYTHTIYFKDKSLVLGTINVPFGRVELGKKSVFKGAIAAEDINVLKDAAFFSHSYTNPLPKIVPDEEDEEVLAGIPTDYVLEQNYPNPFNPSTTIQFALPEAGTVNLKIYNANGQLVRTLASGSFEAGTHSIQWNATNEAGEKVASGFYFYRLQSGNFQQVKRMLLIK